MILLLVLLALLVLAGGVVAVVFAIARGQKQQLTSDNQVVAGTPSRAPLSWAGSHDPEPRLHRRLRDAMKALHAVNAYDTAASLGLRVALEQQALALDDNLVAISALPQPHRERQLPEATRAVEAIEAGVAQYATAATKPDAAALDADLALVQARVDDAALIQRSLGAGGPVPPSPYLTSRDAPTQLSVPIEPPPSAPAAPWQPPRNPEAEGPGAAGPSDETRRF
ncbi:hypothetical protein [Nocardia stercoris]|uniref:Uncharacterized protein n=1 Tax=Nocardia stercoris TaxID=2483361 RepID=A0A3M2L3M9_9NOCA|nr:hypothetical protein [Nocardia stercoris]RMI32257.1 hypothetical protein EBN03_14815 [Nocardia stercoris]